MICGAGLLSIAAVPDLAVDAAPAAGQERGHAMLWNLKAALLVRQPPATYAALRSVFSMLADGDEL